MGLLRLYDAHAAYHAQTSAHERPLATAYLPVWHADVQAFIGCRRASGDNSDPLSHITPALWIPDILYVESRTPTARVSQFAQHGESRLRRDLVTVRPSRRPRAPIHVRGPVLNHIRSIRTERSGDVGHASSRPMASHMRSSERLGVPVLCLPLRTQL